MKRESEKELKSRTEGNLHSISNGSRDAELCVEGTLRLRLRIRMLRCLANRDFPPQQKPKENNCGIILAHFLSSPLKIDGWLWSYIRSKVMGRKRRCGRISSETRSFSSAAAAAVVAYVVVKRREKPANGSFRVHSTRLMDLDCFSSLLFASIMAWLLVLACSLLAVADLFECGEAFFKWSTHHNKLAK